MKQTQMVLINDLSGFGRCSLSVWMPILSAFGNECLQLPTAILSSHTAYPDYVVRDLAQDMNPWIEHWKSLWIHPELLLSGYICDATQGEAVLHAFDAFTQKHVEIFVDPAMADDGKLYPGLEQCVVDKMRQIAARADVIFPNLSEACLLAGVPVDLNWTQSSLCALADALRALGPERIVITGLIREGQVGGVSFDRDGRPSFFFNDRVEPFRHGTGDVYSAVCAGLLALKMPLDRAAREAGQFVRDAMVMANEMNIDAREGVPFEWMLERVIEYRRQYEGERKSV